MSEQIQTELHPLVKSTACPSGMKRPALSFPGLNTVNNGWWRARSRVLSNARLKPTRSREKERVGIDKKGFPIIVCVCVRSWLGMFC